MLIRSRLFGTRMISQAFHTYGGLLVKSSKASDALFKVAVEIADENKCDSIEFRNVIPLPYDLHLRSDKIAMHLKLHSNPDELWNDFRGEIRNRVRKATKAGITVSEGGAELLDDFYRLCGWDAETGIPTPDKLSELGLHRIAGDMKRYESKSR